ncbi:hypothetical protein BJX99DRAFT_2721 [Aspergillus californicus]
MATIQDQLTTNLRAKFLPVSQTWLNEFLSTTNRNVPISALTQTTLFRVLASDLRQSLNTRNTNKLPIDIYDPAVRERRLPASIPVQVIDIEDIGSSLWNKVEAIERVERGEAVRGREIVRTVNVGDDEPDGTNGATNTGAGGNANANANASESNGPHRLILQDAAGTRAVAIEMKRITGIEINKLSIGAKLLLRNATVARGMVLLTPESAEILGGKIEVMDQAWKAGRKARLLEKVTAAGG